MSGAEASSGSVDPTVAVPLQLDVPARAGNDTHGNRKRPRHSHDAVEGPLLPVKKRRNQSEMASYTGASGSNQVPSGQDANDPQTNPLKLEYIQDFISSRIIYPEDAPGIIRQMQNALPADDPFQSLTWKIKEKHSGHVCKVNVPEKLPICSFKEGPALSSAEAENRGCFRLCRELHVRGILDCRLFSLVEGTKQLDSIPSEGVYHEIAKSSNTTRRYMRKRPSFFTGTLSHTTDTVFPLIIRVEGFESRPHAPFLLLARTPFPQLPTFGIYSGGVKATVYLDRGAPFAVDATKLSLLHRYTLRVSRSIVNKPLECTLESLLFFFAPLDMLWANIPAPEALHWSQLPEVVSHIPWDMVESACDNWATSLVRDGRQLVEATLHDCIVQDRSVEFTNRHFVVKVRHDLTPLSKADDSVREAGYENFVEYCKARRKDFTGVKDPNQPMIEVAQVPATVNNLSPAIQTGLTQPKSTLKYLIPELCYKFVIPASTMNTAVLLPSVTHMVERMLLTKELNAKYFHNAIADEHLLAALSPPTACGEHDYERLELLGDAYLKFVTSVYLYAIMPDKREGVLNHSRGQIVSNKALHAGALKCNLPPYIQSKPLIPKVWLPYIVEDGDESDEMSVPRGVAPSQRGDSTEKGKKSKLPRGGKRKKQLDEQSVQWLGDKTVADVVEAIIGAALLSGGHDVAFSVTKALQIDLPRVDIWSDLPRLTPATATRKLSQDTVNAVQKIIGYEFEERAWLAEALTHPTAAGGCANYERLEFLGDAVIDMFTVSYIFAKYPLCGPGTLSLLKAAMVSNSSLAAVCVLVGLFEHVQYNGGGVGNAISAYAKRIRALRDQEYKRARSEGRLPGQFWLEAEPPKVLSDVVEAVMGAIFVNDRYSIEGGQGFFDKVLKPFYVRHIRLQTLSPHPSTTLFELFQAEHCQEHGMRKDVVDGNVQCHVVVHGTVVATGRDRASNIAARKAALAALDALTNDSSFMSRVCSCRTATSSRNAPKKSTLGYEDEEDAQAVEKELSGDSLD